MILISSNVIGWPLEAMRQASLGNEFVLVDIEERHYYLVTEIQESFNYRIEVDENVVTFTPASATSMNYDFHTQAA